MDIYVYDKSFQQLGVIDRYTSLIWRREYHKIGHFELHANVDGYIDLFKKGNLLVKDNDPTDAMEILTVELSNSGSETVTVKGSSIARFLEDRIVWGTQEASGPVESVMKHFVTVNAVNPSKVSRKIPNLVVSTNTGISKTATEVNSWSPLSKLMEELALKYDVGWRVKFDIVNKQFIFDVYTGKDYSGLQDVNPRVIFSDDYENVYEQTYIDSDQTLKSMALIGGQGEGADRRLVSINDSVSGFARKELFVDARDISDKNEDGTLLSNSVYINRLTERGTSRLSENQVLRTFESGISAKSNYTYRVDFDLGDIVTVENTKWGTELHSRLVSIEEVYEGNKVDIRVDFGSNIPTIADKLNKEEKLPVFTGSGYYKSTEIDSKITAVNTSISNVSKQNYVLMPDTRSVVSLPQDLTGRAISFDFKGASTANSPTHRQGNFVHAININGWDSQGSGGYPIQVSFGPNGLSIRQATSATTWGPWKDIPINQSEDWKEASLQNSWVPYASYAPPSYYKDNFGRVYIRGLIRSGTYNVETILFVLPEGYRPIERDIYMINTANGAARLDVTPEGYVFYQGTTNAWVSLANISFRAEQ